MPRTRALVTVLVTGISLAACTASRYQISDALQRYGMSANQASCASEFLRGRLSVSQVNRLSDAARYYNADSRLTFGDLMRVTVSLRDPQVALQVGASAAACGIAADMPVPGL